LTGDRRIKGSDMDSILTIVNGLEPEKALEEIGEALKSIFPVLSEESRGRFLMALVGGSQEDKVSSLVHL
jgi:hypothetical protein